MTTPTPKAAPVEPPLDDFEPLPYVEGPENDADKPKTSKPKGGDDDA